MERGTGVVSVQTLRAELLWVMVDEGIWGNNVMVLTGFAWWFAKYSPDEDQLREAQEDAREDKWGEVDAVPPWDWRKGVRKL